MAPRPSCCQTLGIAGRPPRSPFAFAAFGALAGAAREFRERGSYGFLAGARTGRDAVLAAFSG